MEICCVNVKRDEIYSGRRKKCITYLHKTRVFYLQCMRVLNKIRETHGVLFSSVQDRSADPVDL